MTDREQQRSPEEIQQDIERTREELGETAAALTEKADVKAQAKARAESAKAAAQHKKDELLGKAREAAPDSVGSGAQSVASTAKQNRVPIGVMAAFAGGVLVGWLLKRR